MSGRILLIDDDQHTLDALSLALRGRFEVSTGLGAEEGLDMIRCTGPFGVVVSDLRMPGMDGVEFLARVRRITPETVRVMLTGHGDLDAAMAAVNRGEVFRFLVKPCSTDVLRDVLHEAMEKHRCEGQGSRAMDRLRGMLAEVDSEDQNAALLPDVASLTTRELTVARMIRAGKSTKQIAQDMHLSTRTVETYRDNIRKKLGIANRKVNLQRCLNATID